ncbi:hypothetical protein [Fulvivirga ligni]|uniref:hypothetical protein n=1 Tax=Fulvivirga ligni TaxID=2904246 RepID=UPI001F33EFEC|nr:hypothetical protein [Fulvivirga ligni]UII23575.1 hypothetical protein LVD16_10085 [Fulvivirga ligni]
MSRSNWSSEKILQRLQLNKTKTTYWDNIQELRNRPDEEIFQKVYDFSQSENRKKRIIGIDVLAQLGPGRPYYKQNIELFFNLLGNEKDNDVLISLLYAIGHNNDYLHANEIKKMANFKSVDNAAVRKALVFALLGVDDELAIDVLIELSTDKSSEVRSWATFGIGSQVEVDNDKIREALWNRVNDKDQETKLEAIVGLAERNDLRVKEVIKRELIDGEYGKILFEAIELIHGVEFIPLLKNNLSSGKNTSGVEAEWLKDLEELIAKLENK